MLLQHWHLQPHQFGMPALIYCRARSCGIDAHLASSAPGALVHQMVASNAAPSLIASPKLPSGRLMFRPPIYFSRPHPSSKRCWPKAGAN